MLKQELDKNETLGWNVIVGKDFGSHVFHQTKKYIYLRVLELYVLVWKS
jgi:dynein light chain LC8-type